MLAPPTVTISVRGVLLFKRIKYNSEKYQPKNKYDEKILQQF